MLVVVALFELHIEFAESLKDKRMVVKSLRDKLRRRFEVSAAGARFRPIRLSES